MNNTDKFALIANIISIVIYYIIIIYSYDRVKDGIKTSSSILGKYIGIPLVLSIVGFFPVIVGIVYILYIIIVGIVYILYIIIVGTTNLIRGRKFFEDIETFGFLKDDD